MAFPLLNEKKTDLSNEMLLQVALILEMQNVCEMMCYAMAREFDRSGYKDTFFQRKKQALTEIKTCFERAARLINCNFDETLQKIWNKAALNNETEAVYDAVQWLSMDTLRLLLIYHSRCDADWTKRERIHKAILNFKPDEKVTFDLDGLLKYYNIEKK